MITHIVSDWLFSPCCVEHQDEFIFERVAVAYSRDYNEVGRAQIKPLEIIHTWTYLEGWLFYHGINPGDVVRGQNRLRGQNRRICKFYSSYQEQQLIRNHLYLDHCKWV